MRRKTILDAAPDCVDIASYDRVYPLFSRRIAKLVDNEFIFLRMKERRGIDAPRTKQERLETAWSIILDELGRLSRSYFSLLDAKAPARFVD